MFEGQLKSTSSTPDENPKTASQYAFQHSNLMSSRCEKVEPLSGRTNEHLSGTYRQKYL